MLRRTCETSPDRFHVKHSSGLMAFEALFRKWAQRINLVGAVDAGRCLEPPHPRQRAAGCRLRQRRCAGSISAPAADFPASCSLSCSPSDLARSIDLVESNRKKAGFLQAAIGAVRRCRRRFIAERIDDVYGACAQPEIVTARALAPLAGAARPCRRRGCPGGATGLFHKGRDYRQRSRRKRSRVGVRSGRTSKQDRSAGRHSRDSRSRRR